MAATSAQLSALLFQSFPVTGLIQLRFLLNEINHFQIVFSGESIPARFCYLMEPLLHKYRKELSILVERMGLPENTIEKFLDDVNMRSSTLAILDSILNSLKPVTPPSINIPELKRKSYYEIRQDFTLLNPFVVWQIEKELKYDETGDLEMMLTNWGKMDHVKCERFRSELECFKMTLARDNLSGFINLLPDILKRDDMNEMKVRNLVTLSYSAPKIFKYLLDTQFIPKSDYLNIFESVVRLDYRTIGTEEIAIILFNRFTIDINDLNKFFPIMVNRGHSKLVEIVLLARPDLDFEVIDTAFERQIYDDFNPDMISALKIRISCDEEFNQFGFKRIGYDLYRTLRYKDLRKFIEIFEIDKSQLDEETQDYLANDLLH